MPTREQLALERKKLLAEFELQGVDSIQISGRELHRQDVVNLFDELRNEEKFSFHLGIWEAGDLRSFLETGIYRTGMKWWFSLGNTDLKQISPWFAEAQDYFFKRILNSECYGYLDEFFEQPILMLPNDYGTGYKATTRYFREKLNSLMSLLFLAENRESLPETALQNWTTDDGLRLLNHLPETFYELRYSLADMLNKIAISCFQSKKISLAEIAIRQAADIKIDYGELATLIPHNLYIISQGLVDPNKASTKKKWLREEIVFLIIIGCLALTAFVATWIQESFPSAESKSNQVSDWQKETVLTNTVKSLLSSAKMHAEYFQEEATLGFVNHQPLKAGDNPFEDVFSAINFQTLTDTSNQNNIHFAIRNKSKWDVIIVYVFNNQDARSLYVPARTNYLIRLLQNCPILLDVLVGNGWDENHRLLFEKYINKKRILSTFAKGYFKEIPIIHNEPLFDRASATDLPSKTIEISPSDKDSEGIQIEFTFENLPPLTPGPFR